MEKSRYYIGIISSIDDESLRGKEYHEVLVDIPEVAKGIRAFPKRGEIDEPKVGDIVLLLSLDPVYNSYMIYSKLKEDEFLGFRASGKLLNVTPDSLTLGIFDQEYESGEVPESLKASIALGKDGDLKIKCSEKIKIDSYHGNEGSIVFNGGNNLGLVNIGSLRPILQAIGLDLLACGGNANFQAAMDTFGSTLEDKNIKH